MKNPPLQLLAWLDHPRIARATSTRVRVVAEIVADPAAAVPADRPPLAVLLALDTSGSMQGEKLRQVARSVELVVDQLTTRDLIAVTCFSNDARVAVPLTPRAAWKASVLSALGADGGTNIAAGLELAARLFDVKVPPARGTLVLLSDGQPNVGAATPRELASLARALRERLSISTLGYGEDHNDAVLASIAESGGGCYAYIATPEQCRVELARVVGAQVDVIADRIVLAFEPAAGIAGAGELELPDVCAGDRRIAAFDLEVPALPELGSATLGRLVLTCRSAAGELVSIPVVVDVHVAERSGPRNAVAHGLGLVRDGELARTVASRLADAGSFAEARRALRACLDRIRDALPESAMPRLDDMAEQLVDDIALLDQRPDEEALRAYRRGQHALGTPHASPMLARAYGSVPKATVCILGDRGASPIVLEREMTFGRTASADVQLLSSQVSRRHTRIVAVDGAFWVNDLGSSNGTRLNGAAVTSQRLHDGDVIEIGDVRLLFRNT
jgi:Ca-activated chloride channel homolog